MSQVRDKLKDLKTKGKEPQLFPYLQQLFLKMGYSNVEVVHGKDEYGKDLVFSEYDTKKKREQWTAVVVKNKDASMQDFEDGGEIMRQIKLSFKHPFTNSLGEQKQVSSVIVIVNGSISVQAKSVIDKTIEGHLKANLINWNYQRLEEEITQHIKDDFLSDYEVSYNNYKNAQIALLSKLENSNELFHDLTINDINDIYITAKTNYDKYQKRKDHYITYEDETKSIPKNESVDDAIEILHGNRDCFIYGIPTSGKSLLLKRIGIHALQENLEKPIAVFFWEFSKVIPVDKFEIETSMLDQYKIHSKEDFDLSNFSKVLFLFDALDEIKNDQDKYLAIVKILKFKLEYHLKFDEKRREKESALNELLVEFSKSTDTLETLSILNRINDLDGFIKGRPLQIVISSRDQKIVQEKEVLNRFVMVELLPFNVGQALKLVKKLIPNSAAKSNSFVKAIKNGLLNNNLARTPLALTLMAVLYKEDQIDLAELPANITELYNKFTDFYLERWDSKKGVSAQYKYEEARQILALIASELQCRGLKVIEEVELKEILEKIKMKHDFSDLKHTDRFISSLKERPGLFQYNELDNTFYFYHLTFQEYFSSISFDDSNENILLDNFFSEWWENTIIFYCGKQPRREVFIRKVHSEKIPMDLIQSYRYFTLVSKCIQANHLVSKELKKEILRSLIFNFDNFYVQIVKKDLENGNGITYTLSTIDLIMQLREYFLNNLFSKHINIADLKVIYGDCAASDFKNLSDVTIYCISYLLSSKENDPIYLADFARHPSMNVRWSRIVHVDIQVLKLEKKLQSKVKSKIEQRQRKNKDYIKEQFGDKAILHLMDIDSISQKLEIGE